MPTKRKNPSKANKKPKHMKAKKYLSDAELKKHGNYVERALRLKRVVEDLPITAAFPLLYEAKLDEYFVNKIRSAANIYLFSSLNAMRKKNYIFDHRINLLKQFEKECVNLPNRTPNGILMPKKENCLEFNLLIRTVAEILQSYNLSSVLQSVMVPMSSRLVSSAKDKKGAKRPYASTYVHTDVWSGSPPNLIAVFIPVLGDIEHTTVQYWEPDEKTMGNYERVLNHYEEGEAVASTATKYDVKLRNGYIYFMDAYLLHQTVKLGGHSRLSIDLRVIAKETAKGDFISEGHDHSNWKLQFVDIEKFFKLSQSQLMITEATMQEASQMFNPSASSGGMGMKSSVKYDEYFKYVDLFS